MRWHRHYWTEWTEPQADRDLVGLWQEKTCTKCGFTVSRRVR